MLPSAPEQQPYLGSRPFGRDDADRRRFFGRTREIEELTALVMSHNLVLVYAASGVGKSSLLDAGIVPELVDEGFEVLPRGRVGMSLPADALLERETNPYVANLLCSLSPDAEVSSLVNVPLADHLRALPRRAGTAGRVMVIDQAEELFTFMPTDWQARQRAFFLALRDALRDDPDLRVIIVAREDYLARFDDLAPILPGGLRVRLRLEALGRAAALEAVERPLAGTHRRFDRGVAEQLISDLSRTKIMLGTGAREEPGPYVEPVQLQIVCSALWDRLPAHVAVITAEHLQEFGDVEETLERFYTDMILDCVAATGYEQEALARWFGDKLITPSDTRGQVFQGPTETEGLPNHVVAFLEAKHVLRAEERASGRWYELAHDRLIRPVRTVNDAWSRAWARCRTRRRIARWASMVAATSVLVSVIAGAIASSRLKTRAREQAREYEIAVRPVEELRRECEKETPECALKKVRVFDFLADYHWRHGKVDELVTLLRRAATMIPSDYGMILSNSPATGDVTTHPGALRIEYNPERPLDEWRMRGEWTAIANSLAEGWGIPVSRAIVLASDRRVPLQSVRISATPASCVSSKEPSRVSLSVTMPARNGEALVSRSDIEKDKRLSAFFQKFSATDGWEEYEQLAFGGPWWFVPAWTLPIWRVGGHPAVSREAALAVVVANEVIEHPEIVVSCDALHAILRKAYETAPVTVNEALSARGLEELRLDLIEMVREQKAPLSHPSMLLDALANHPGISSDLAALQAHRELQSSTGQQEALAGPWPHPSVFSPKQRPTPELDELLAGAADCRAKPLVVHLGSSVKPVLVDDEGNLKETILRRIHDMRGALYQRHGVLAPGVQFVEWEGEGIKIIALNQETDSDDAKVLTVTSFDVTDRLAEELEERLRALRTWWVTAETISLALDELRPEERLWLTRRYSITDLKQLARAAIASDDDDGATLRDLPWLLRSLMFWTSTTDAKDIDGLSESLRATGRTARQVGPSPAHEGSDGTPALVRGGLAALDSGNASKAVRWFTQANQRDPSAASDAFVAGYQELSSLAPRRRVKTLTDACRSTISGGASGLHSMVYDVEEALADQGQSTSPARHHLELCLAGLLVKLPTETRQRLLKLVTEVPIDSWSSEEALFLAKSWLQANHQVTTPPRELDKVRLLLARGVSHTTDAELQSTWNAIREDVGQNPWHWIRELMADVAGAPPAGSKWLTWTIADWLNSFGELEAQRADQLLAALDPRITVPERASFGLSRALVISHLGDHGDAAQRAARLEDAAARLQKLLRAAPSREYARDVASTLANVYVKLGTPTKAREVIAKATRGDLDLSVFDEETFWIEIGSGAEREARTVADRMLQRDPSAIDSLFVNAVLATLTRSKDFEAAARAFIFNDEQKPHPYVDYVRLMLFWALSENGRDDDARQLLDARMRTIRSDTWPGRLQQRDTMVWREMLIAYFAGTESEASIFERLRDQESFRTSGLHQTEMTLDGVRCEAYFYAALREHVTGPRESRDQRYRSKLQLVLDTEQKAYLEYRMAQFLLHHHES